MPGHVPKSVFGQQQKALSRLVPVLGHWAREPSLKGGQRLGYRKEVFTVVNYGNALKLEKKIF